MKENCQDCRKLQEQIEFLKEKLTKSENTSIALLLIVTMFGRSLDVQKLLENKI